MDTKPVANPVDRRGDDDYRPPELIVHGDVAKLTAGPGVGSADIGAQTSTFPGDER